MSRSLVTAREVHGPHGARAVAAVHGRAFLDDPVMLWLVRGPDRQARLTRLFGCFAGTASRTPGARLLLGGGLRVAAVWLPPGRVVPSPWEQLRTAPASAGAVRGGVVRGLRVEVAQLGARPAEPHWYLHALGAVPEAQGTGVGGSVVQPVLDACDDAGLPAYLESSNPRNWSFYERHGFVRSAPLPVPRGCPPLVPMRREPR